MITDDTRRIALYAAAALVAGTTGCVGVEFDRPDQTPPLFVALDVGEGSAASPTGEVVLRFSEPLAPASIDDTTVAIVPFAIGDRCTVDLSCGTGRCHQGRCQTPIADQRWLSDLAHPPLSSARQDDTVRVAVRPDDSGSNIIVQFVEPLTPACLHSLLISGAVRDVAGNPLGKNENGDSGVIVTFATTTGEGSRPTMALVFPAPGTTELPRNLNRLVVHFSAPVDGVTSQTLWLEDRDGRTFRGEVVAEPPGCAGRVPQTCFVLRFATDFPPLTEIQLRASDDIRDDDGQPIIEAAAQWIATGNTRDEGAPEVLAFDQRVAEQCAVATLVISEPSTVIVQADRLPEPLIFQGATEAQLALADLPAGTHTVAITLTDLAGNQREVTYPFIIERVPSVLITEVLANPRGAEPAQEWIEIYNAADIAHELAGWQINDQVDPTAGVALPATTLPAGQYALIVGPRYAPEPTLDPVPPANTVLIRLAKNIGLANRGDPLFLRAADGQLISTYGGYFDVSDKRHNGQSVERVDSAICDIADNWRLEPQASASPGAGPRSE